MGQWTKSLTRSIGQERTSAGASKDCRWLSVFMLDDSQTSHKAKGLCQHRMCGARVHPDLKCAYTLQWPQTAMMNWMPSSLHM